VVHRAHKQQLYRLAGSGGRRREAGGGGVQGDDARERASRGAAGIGLGEQLAQRSIIGAIPSNPVSSG
jgi:hypothetical protein